MYLILEKDPFCFYVFMIAPSDHIQLHLRTDHASVQDISLVSKRTLMASRTLEGKSLEDTINLLPLLFSLCGTAQQQSGLMAVENALGLHPDDNQRLAREILLDGEGIGEHITRIMMDWSSHAYVDTKITKIRECRKKISEFKSLLFQDDLALKPGGNDLNPQTDPLLRHCLHIIDVCEQDIFGCSIHEFYALRSEEDLRAWLQSNVAIGAACLKIWTYHGYFEQPWPQITALPEIPDVFLDKRLDSAEADHFIAEPSFDKIGYETGPVARHAKHPLLKNMDSSAKTRLLAKLLDLAKMLIELSEKIEKLSGSNHTEQREAPLKGTGVVDAVRGRLCHRVWLDPSGKYIERYRILAPTEWNFHPQGMLRKALIGTKFPDNRKLLEQARLFVLALDPCVACDLDILEMDQRNHA